MDWAKTKNIIIVALIMVNLFLFGIYITKSEQTDNRYDEKILKEVMREKRVKIENEPLVNFDKITTLKISYETNIKERINNIARKKGTVKLKKRDDYENIKRYLEDIMEELNISRDYFAFSKIEKKDNNIRVIYRSIYKSQNIGGGEFYFEFRNNKFKDFRGKIIKEVKETKNRMEISSPYLAVLKSVSLNDFPKNKDIIVKEIRKGYIINSSNFEENELLSDTAFPAWEIFYKSGKQEYIESYIE